MVLIERSSLALPAPVVAWATVFLEAERDRFLLWLPVAFGLGIGIYFALSAEPDLWVGPLALGLVLVALVLLRRFLATLFLLGLLAMLAGGFSAAGLRTALVAAPLLTERVGPTRVEGRIVALDRRTDSLRLWIEPEAVGGLTARELPDRVRLRLAGGQMRSLRPGDRLRLLAMLLPPPPPAVPGGYDFGRDAFFRGIGAVGFVMGEPEVLSQQVVGGWALFWERLRDALGLTLRRALAPAEAGVAEALLTGQRAGIDPGLQESYRISGLAHLLAISGLHVGLIAGIFFFALRALLALVPSLALRWPIKKVAALATALLLPLYLPMVGASVPTQRACLMALIVLAAVLLDRRAISLRLVAVAAFLVLLLAPETLLSASFQLSFAAVTALVAAYESWRSHLPQRRRDEGPGRRVFIYLFGVLLSSLIAGLATAPFAAYHFHRLALYGLAANALAVPLTAFWVMPWCLVSYLLLPFGLESLAFQPLGWGLSALNAIARTFAALPGAAQPVPAMPLWGLACLSAGGLWLCLWRSRLRFAGLALLLAGAVSPALQRPPDILIAGDTRLIALAAPGGTLWLSSDRRSTFQAGVWLRRRAQEEVPVWQSAGPATRPWLLCDRVGCRYRHGRWLTALALEAEALREDCRGVDLLVATVPLPRDCLPNRPKIGFFQLWRYGTHAVWLLEGRAEMETVASSRGERPWSPPRRSGRRVFLPGGQ